MCVACTYAQEIEAVDQEQAFAIAYLDLALSPLDTIISRSITPVSEEQPPKQAEENTEKTKTTFFVEMEYICTETINF